MLYVCILYMQRSHFYPIFMCGKDHSHSQHHFNAPGCAWCSHWCSWVGGIYWEGRGYALHNECCSVIWWLQQPGLQLAQMTQIWSDLVTALTGKCSILPPAPRSLPTAGNAVLKLWMGSCNQQSAELQLSLTDGYSKWGNGKRFILSNDAETFLGDIYRTAVLLQPSGRPSAMRICFRLCCRLSASDCSLAEVIVWITFNQLQEYWWQLSSSMTSMVGKGQRNFFLFTVSTEKKIYIYQHIIQYVRVKF